MNRGHYTCMLRADKKSEWCYCNDLQVIKKKWLKGAQEAYMLFLEQVKFLLGRRAQERAGRVGASGPGEAKGLSGDMILTLSSVVDHGGESVYFTTWVHPDEMPDRRFLGVFNVVLRKC
ncbi:hypothetical protein ALC57_02923 [Trachymyrmex cornetzi]|uniref:USP domain-containing protein n=1 Tax=Trachymyrmex cornetzi TaxID=471704 RepID=A0A151JN99_9HYME|nr:hypothetical protein ALC57_02923 [Trachymyrmex cornetzi]